MKQVVASAKFRSQSQPGITWETEAYDDGTGSCKCLGFGAHGKCWHVQALIHKQTKRKKDNAQRQTNHREETSRSPFEP